MDMKVNSVHRGKLDRARILREPNGHHAKRTSARQLRGSLRMRSIPRAETRPRGEMVT